MLSAATLEILRDWLQIARLGVLAGFVVLGVRILRVQGWPEKRKRIDHLLVYVIAVHVGLIVSGSDAWPFSTYPMMSVDVRDHTREQEYLVFRGVDARGREWELDPDAFSPLYPQNMTAWIDVVRPKITGPELDTALRFMLERAEEARARRAAGERYIGNAALLGPFAAPDIDVRFDVAPSPLPFQSLRVYRGRWVPADLKRGGRAILWQLEHEVRR